MLLQVWATGFRIQIANRVECVFQHVQREQFQKMFHLNQVLLNWNQLKPFVIIVPLDVLIELNHKNGFVMKTTGKEGLVNKDANLCRFPKFGYNYMNDKSRITKPLLKVNGRFEEISFEKAFDLIAEKVKGVNADDNVFFAGARLTNEEMYLVQKLARGGVKTNNVSSFHYLNRGDGYIYDSASNVPFDQLYGASKIYLLGSEIKCG